MSDLGLPPSGGDVIPTPISVGITTRPKGGEFRWPESLIERFIELWKSGDSASIIASELGVTRSSVIGQAHRLREKGLVEARRTGIRSAGGRSLRPAAKEPRERKAYRPRLPSAAVKLRSWQEAARLSARVLSDPPEMGLVSIIQLEHHHCKWIADEGIEPLYCGNITHEHRYGSSWCLFHAGIVFSC